MERFTLPEALQDTNEKLGENVQSIVRPLTDPSVRAARPSLAGQTRQSRPAAYILTIFGNGDEAQSTNSHTQAQACAAAVVLRRSEQG